MQDNVWKWQHESPPETVNQGNRKCPVFSSWGEFKPQNFIPFMAPLVKT